MRIFCMLVLATVSMSLLADDFKEVKNGRMHNGSYTLELTEDLRFGAEDGDDEYLWPGASVVMDANAEGHMFVVDSIGRRLIEFDKNGKLVKVVGGPGEGPGEFANIISFQVMPDNTGIAFSSQGPSFAFHYFDKDGKFLKRDAKNGAGFVLRTAFFSPDGKRIGGRVTSNEADKPTGSVFYAVMNDKFEVQQELLTMENPVFDRSRAMDPNYWAEHMGKTLKPFADGDAAYFAFDGDGNLYTAVGKEYKVTKWGPNGKKLMTIERDYKPISQSQEEIQAITDPVLELLHSRLPPQLRNVVTDKVMAKAVENANFPPIKPPIFGLKTLEDGTLIVIHDLSHLTRKAVGDIYDKSGKYVGSFSHEGKGLERMVFKNGYAYAVETDDLGDNTVARYKVSLKRK